MTEKAPSSAPAPKTPDIKKAPTATTPDKTTPKPADTKPAATPEVFKPRKPLEDRIEDAGDDLDSSFEDMEDGDAGMGWFKTQRRKLMNKMSWFPDIKNYVGLHYNEKSNTDDHIDAYDGLIHKKKGEIRSAEKKIKKASKNAEKNKKYAGEKLASINRQIEEARATGNDSLLEVLLKSKENAEKDLTGIVGVLEDERNHLVSELRNFNERKKIIFDSFIADVDAQIEKIKDKDNYHENVENRKELDVGIEKLSKLINEAEVQIIDLRKSLSKAGNDKYDREIIKDKINELVEAIRNNQGKI